MTNSLCMFNAWGLVNEYKMNKFYIFAYEITNIVQRIYIYDYVWLILLSIIITVILYCVKEIQHIGWRAWCSTVWRSETTGSHRSCPSTQSSDSAVGRGHLCFGHWEWRDCSRRLGQGWWACLLCRSNTNTLICIAPKIITLTWLSSQ